MSEERYAQWSILELLGHRRLAGFVTEQEIAGKGFLRIDIPGTEKKGPLTQFYSPDSVYGLTPTTEELARGAAASSSPEPVSRWELRLSEGERQLATMDVGEDVEHQDGE
jgi:hypothetical protein